MTTPEKLKRQHVSTDLFQNRINNLEALCYASKDAAFLAIDIEHVAVTSENDRLLHQVGVAYLQTLKPPPVPASADPALGRFSRSYLKEFYVQKRVRGLTFNVHISKEREEDLRLRGMSLPARRPHSFGHSSDVYFQNLESIIVTFIRSCNHRTNLVLMGFGVADDWSYLSKILPRAMPFFSAWVDLNDIVKEISIPAGPSLGLQSLLWNFGYHMTDIKPKKSDYGQGSANNAGNDAVAICALAQALLSPKNHEKLKIRQRCAQIAGYTTEKKVCRVASLKDLFPVIIIVDGGLPRSISSGLRMARYFHTLSPKRTGIISHDTAFLTFESQDRLDRFERSINGHRLPTGELLTVRCYHRDRETIENDIKESEKMPALTRGKEMDRAENAFEALHKLFVQDDERCDQILEPTPRRLHKVFTA